MIEYIIAIFAGTLALGMVSWHLTRVISDGSLFGPLRDQLFERYRRTGHQFNDLYPDNWQGAPGWCGKCNEPREHANHITPTPNTTFRLFYEGLTCRLCFGTEIAIVLTWGALITILVANWYEPVPPLAYWFFAFTVGPFLTAAWGEVLRRIECLEAPE